MLKHLFRSHCDAEYTLYIIYSSCVLVAVSKMNFHVSRMLSTLSRYNVTFTLLSWPACFMTLHVIANPLLFLLNLFKSFFSLERCLETEAAQNYCLLK